MSQVIDGTESSCKCCLKNGLHKDMWAEYINDGEVEIYGEMLMECFQLPWSKPDDYLEQICERCILKLRKALEFRQEILSSEEAMKEFMRPADEKGLLKVKSENVEEENFVIEEYEYQEEETEYAEGEVTKEEESAGDEEAEYLSCDLEEGSSPGRDMEVEYLEDDVEAKTVLKMEKPGTRKSRKSKNKYKQYTSEDLEKALQMVAKNKMTRAEASHKYKVPVKTLGYRLRAMEAEEDSEGKPKPNKFFEEIRTILTYTNATPYKTKVGRLFCAYCSTEGPIFETPDSLRTHTRTVHYNERLKSVEIFMRPNYLNEVVKVDIENLHCTVCMTPIENWNSMFEHLKEKHNVELDLAYTKVIPYVLDEEILCCLCKQKFSHFHLLDVHMNSHYNNYICGECGDSFLSESRMKKHIETHSTQRYPCSLCGKTFTLEKYRKKHFDGVHLKERKFKCNFCQEMFAQDYSRHLHLLATHKEKVRLIYCEYCESTFTWRPYYLKHMRLNHTRPAKRFACKKCTKKFHLKSELKNHEDWHVGKGFTCPVCQRKFSSKNYLQKHIAIHIQDGTSNAEDVDGIEVFEIEKPDSEEAIVGE